MNYILMHRNIAVAEIVLDELSLISDVTDIINFPHLPVGTVRDGMFDKRLLQRWWANRSIPASRSGFREVLHGLGFAVPQELLDRCFGLSLSDQYWINPKDHPLKWEDINFFDNSFSEDVGNLLFGSMDYSKQISLISPDNTSDGQLMKKWKIVDGKRVLLKGASRPYFQEAYNEMIASEIANRLGISHVSYDIAMESGVPCSICEDFIDRDTELIPAFHIMQMSKKPNHMTEYEFYIALCEKFGVSDIRRKLEEMMILDFLIVNVDRHFNNFGLIRNARTLEWVDAAPIFDCGTSLWFNEQEKNIKPWSPALVSKPFRKTHQEQLQLVHDFSWINWETLDGIETYSYDILLQSDELSEKRCRVVSEALAQRIELLKEYCNI